MHLRNLSQKTHLLVLILLVFGICILRALHLSFVDLPLFFDESQYFGWAQNLDFGFYSKPPMVALMIAGTTAFCGDMEACVRISSPILHSLTAILIYLLASKHYTLKIGILSSLTYLTLPAVGLSSSLVSTDPSLLFFWSLALYSFDRAMDAPKNLFFWILAGIASGLGLQSKYTMILFIPSVLLYLKFDNKLIDVVKKQGFWLACILAFLVFLPNLWWNASSGFVSFLHTRDNADLSADWFNPDQFFVFLMSQFGVFGPILFGTLLVLITRFLVSKTASSKKDKLWFSFIVPFFMVILLVSFLSRAHANWAAPIYIAATIWVSATLYQYVPKIFYTSLMIHIILLVSFWSLPFLLPHAPIELTGRTTDFSQSPIKIKDPFRRLRGWDQLGAEVQTWMDNYPEYHVLTVSRKTHAALLYYTDAGDQLVKWNSNQRINDHYELTTFVRKNQPYLLIIEWSNPRSVLDHFNRYEYKGDIVIPLYSDFSRSYKVYTVDDIQETYAHQKN